MANENDGLQNLSTALLATVIESDDGIVEPNLSTESSILIVEKSNKVHSEMLLIFTARIFNALISKIVKVPRLILRSSFPDPSSNSAPSDARIV